MKTEDTGFFALMLFVAFLGFLVGAAVMRHTFENRAVEKGFAQYNSQTGTWEWKDVAQKEKLDNQSENAERP